MKHGRWTTLTRPNDGHTLTDERSLYAETVAPEVRAAVGHSAVTEQVTVTDGVQVGNCAEVISAWTAASPPLAVGTKWVPDAAHVQRAGQIPLGPPGQKSLCSTLTDHQEKHRHSRQQELHDKSVEVRDQEVRHSEFTES